MSDQRTQRMHEELAELWAATFGEQPSICADPQTMIRVLVACLKDPGPFELSEMAATAAKEPQSEEEVA